MSISIVKPEEIKNEIMSFFKNKSIIPIVGAGLTCGIKSKNGQVPSGQLYKEHMIETLVESNKFTDEEKEEFQLESFSNICDYYEDDTIVLGEKRVDFWKKNFYRINMGLDYRKQFLDIDWPYIYSLNIDDAIENSSVYSKVILPNREFRSELLNEEKCVIKLHGDVNELVTYKVADKVFSSKEYALSIERNAAILGMLRNDFRNQNILFIGCSLDDEMDLKSIDSLPVDYQNKDNLSKTIIFVKGQPGQKMISKYKTYGITDVVCFDEYTEMYSYLYETWQESLQVQDSELDFYTGIPIKNIPATEINSNWEFFFWGKSLFDNKLREMKSPYFFVRRNISYVICKNLSKNKVHLIYGARLSGKTYCLAELFQSIKDRPVYYFDGRSRLSQRALCLLMEKANIVVLFDVGALSKEQFEIVLQDAKSINMNGNNFIVCLNNNDSDTLGVVKWKLRQGFIDDNDIISYEVHNKFDNNQGTNEIDEINSKYPKLHLPPYKKERTLVDQIMYAEDVLNVKSKYSNNHIVISNEKQLALLILLAIKEKMYSLEIEKYGLDVEIIEAIKRYNPLIERVEVRVAEKENSDLSNVKYVLNSKYWLRRELGEFAREIGNEEFVATAYYYIIECVKRYSKGDENKQRETCRDLVRFDVMNDIFLDRFKGNIGLIVCIYTKLHTLLAEDFNFLHQNAKCYLNYFYYTKNIDDKRKYLAEANKLAIVSHEMVEKKLNETYNEKLSISLAHVKFTNAIIYSELCRQNEYKNIEYIEKAIESILEAWESPYNDKERKRDVKERSSRGITRFINELTEKVDIQLLPKISRDQYEEILGIYINGRL